MKTILKTIVGLLLIVVLALLAVVFVVPANTLKPMLERAASDAMARPVAIDGELSWRLWPPLALEMSGLRVANLPGLEPADMVVAERMRLEVDALAWISGNLDLTEFTLERPIVHLHKDANGVANWEFAASGAEAAPAEPGVGREPTSDLPRVSIGEIALRQGELTFVDEQAQIRHKVEALNVNVQQDDTALVAEALATYNEQDIQLNAVIADANALATGQSSNIDVAMTSPLAMLNLQGVAATHGLDKSSLGLELPDLDGLITWLQIQADLPPEMPKTLSLQAQLAANPELLAISQIELLAQPFEVRGNIDLALGERTKIAAILETAALDLTPYMPAEAEVAEAEPQAAETAEAGSAGWSDEPLDLPLPLPFDLDLAVSFPSIKAGELQTGAGALQVYADTLAARVDITDLALYGGSVAAALNIQEFGQSPRIALQSEIAQVQTGPLLQALAQFDRLEGTSNLQADIQTSGASIKSMVEAVQGQGTVLFRDGAILGINIAGTLRQIATLGLDQDVSGAKRTDFAEMGGSFVIENGRLTNDDFQLRAPVLRIQGAGTVDLPAQSLDYAVTPRLSATLEGQDAEAEPAIGAGIPLVFSGPWANPKIQLAIGGTLSGDLRDPQALVGLVGQLTSDPEQLVKLREQFGVEGSPLDGIGSLLGGDNGESVIPLVEDAKGAVEDLKDQVDQLKEGLGGLLQR